MLIVGAKRRCIPEKPVNRIGRINKTTALAVTMTLSLMVLEQNAFAQTAYDKSVRTWLKMPGEWFVCETVNDCSLTCMPCGTSIAVRKNYKWEAASRIHNLIGGPQPGVCSPFPCGQSTSDTSVAVCDAGQCSTVVQPESTRPTQRLH
jgi:hypothetical protein